MIIKYLHNFIFSSFKFFIKKFLEIIYPCHCIICNNINLEKVGLCSTCWEKINFINYPHCHICSLPFEYKSFNHICLPCSIANNYFDQVLSIFIYDNFSKKLIFDLKYNDKKHAINIFTNWLSIAYYKLDKQIDFIVPVPLHILKLFNRKYNQTLKIAYPLSKNLNLPLVPNLLKRIKYKKSQTFFNREQRTLQVKNNFKFNVKYKLLVKNKNILLIDDVFTTGATVNECAKILKKSGCKNIYVLTLAKVLI